MIASILATLLLGQTTSTAKPASEIQPRIYPSLRELCWRADAVVLASVQDGKKGLVEVLEVLSGDAGSPGKTITVQLGIETGWAKPGAPEWRWLLLFLTKNGESTTWRVLPGGWRGSTGGDQVFQPDSFRGDPNAMAQPTWDQLMEKIRGDLAAVNSLKNTLAIAPGSRDSGIFEWLGRHANPNLGKHPEAIWPGAAGAALDALYESPLAQSRWAAARLEKKSEPGTRIKRGLPFATNEQIQSLLEILGGQGTSVADQSLVLDLLAAGLEAGGKPTGATLTKLLEVLPNKAESISLRLGALRAMGTLASVSPGVLPEPTRESWLRLAENLHRSEKRPGELGWLARLIFLLGGPEAYAKAGGNPGGVILLVEGQVAEGSLLRCYLSQAGTPNLFQDAPQLRLEKVDDSGKVVATREEALEALGPSPWKEGWKGPAVIPFQLQTRPLESGKWRLTVRFKQKGVTPERWYSSEAFWFQVKVANRQDPNNPIPVVVFSEKP